jgi:glycosyltransferase involved in cell wall biosynthesis
VKTVLFVHQSADLYGSDKVLLNLVRAIQGRGFKAIVLLPVEGPLRERLESAGVETYVAPVAKLSRACFSPLGLFRLPGHILRAMRHMDTLLQGREISLVHSNTLAVLGGACWARWRRVPHLWHVHELLIAPALVRVGFPWLLRLMADLVMCNSTMTAKWVVEAQPKLAQRTVVVWNGIEPPNSEIDSVQYDVDGDAPNQVCVALVGRINRLKGQVLLVEAASRLWDQGVRHVKYLLVGSPPEGQEHYLEQLRSVIASSPAREMFVVRDFQENIWPVWNECDIAVIPSTEPESFGLVAIEAMAAGKPVVAAAHGGLLDIVDDNRTGLLVPPNDVDALARALRRLIDDRTLRWEFGKAGRARQMELFSLAAQVDETIRCYEKLLSNDD